MSRKERRKIYLEAAKYFDRPESERTMKEHPAFSVDGFCEYINEFFTKNVFMLMFEEYCLFRPSTKEFQHLSNAYWFGYDDQSARIIALLFAAEMCNDKQPKEVETLK